MSSASNFEARRSSYYVDFYGEQVGRPGVIPSLIRPSRFFRTDVRYMRKGQLFASSGQFGLAALVSAAMVFVAAVLGMPPGPREPNAVIMGGFFVFLILTMMGVGGSLYLLVRGLLRSPSYDPQRVWEADQAKAAQGRNL